MPGMRTGNCILSDLQPRVGCGAVEHCGLAGRPKDGAPQIAVGEAAVDFNAKEPTQWKPVLRHSK